MGVEIYLVKPVNTVKGKSGLQIKILMLQNERKAIEVLYWTQLVSFRLTAKLMQSINYCIRILQVPPSYKFLFAGFEALCTGPSSTLMPSSVQVGVFSQTELM